MTDDLDDGFAESLEDGIREAEAQVAREVAAERRGSNRYLGMSLAEVGRLADRTRLNQTAEPDDGYTGRFAEMPDDVIRRIADDVKSGGAERFKMEKQPDGRIVVTEDELNDENDPGGFQRWARRGMQAKALGLPEDVGRLYADGDISLDEAINRRDDALAEERGEPVLNDMERLSDAQFAELYSAVKSGATTVSGSGVDRSTFSRQASGWLAPPSFDEEE